MKEKEKKKKKGGREEGRKPSQQRAALSVVTLRTYDVGVVFKVIWIGSLFSSLYWGGSVYLKYSWGHGFRFAFHFRVPPV